jgi:N-dimethylarginine dimethylaminohydrolase
MYHITIKPETYSFDKELVDQHPYCEKHTKIDKQEAYRQHKTLCLNLENTLKFAMYRKDEFLPDIVFISSAGLSLPRLPEPLIILPNMKYAQRKAELPYIKEIFKELKIKTIDFPDKAPFEGQSECKWFHGGDLLIVGYGFRNNKETVNTLKNLLTEIYTTYGLVPPTVLGIRLKIFDYYRLDMAMLETSELSCIIHVNSIKDRDLYKLEKELGKSHIKIIDTYDKFCLNSVINGDSLLTHKLHNPELKRFLEMETGKTVVEIDTSEYEKTGGSVRCLVFDIFDPRAIKRKKHSHSCPSSPK